MPDSKPDLITDADSLAAFVRTRSPDALSPLVFRYLDLVYTVAMRLVCDAGLADDVTQATIIVLMKKAHRVSPDRLPGWLVNTTRLAAKETLRSISLRKKHEFRAAHIRLQVASSALQSPADEPAANDLLPLLDDALARLNALDRTAVVLRFFQGKTFAEVGVAVGCTEEAARKRVERAVEKLRIIFIGKGEPSSVGGVMIVLASQQSRSAPTGLTAKVLHIAASGDHATTSLASGAVKSAKTKLLIGLLVPISILLSFVLRGRLGQSRHTPSQGAISPPSMTTAGRTPLPPQAMFSATPISDPTLVSMPYLAGWPRMLPGAVAATPVVADLDGNGQFAVIVPCLQRQIPPFRAATRTRGRLLAVPLLFALHSDGSTVDGWPIALGPEGDADLISWRQWFVSPAIIRQPSGRDAIVAVGPARNVVILNNDRGVTIEISKCWQAPVIGDSRGKKKVELFAGYDANRWAYAWDGKPWPQRAGDGVWNGPMLRTPGFASIADLNGDGIAETIVFDLPTHSINVFHDDSSTPKDSQSTQPGVDKPSATRGPMPSGEDVIATISGEASGISVVSLGDDPKVMDFFAGTYWVRRFPDGRTEIKNMFPRVVATEWTQPSVVDLNHDGKSDVIFGLSDGRIFVYETGLNYHPDRMQWPTENGDFQHSGFWKPRLSAVSK